MVACVLCTTDVLATATACVVVSTNGMMDGYAMYYVYAIIISISTREDVVCSVVAIISTCGGGGYTAMRCSDDML